MISIEDCVELAIRGLEVYVHGSEERLIQAASIQTDYVLEARRPDLAVVDKERSCKIVDFVVPGDSRIGEKEKDKIEKYQD